MDLEITHTSLLEQIISFLHTNTEGGAAEQTQPKSAGNQPSHEDSLLSLDTRISEIEEIFAENPIPAPESFMTVEFAHTSHSSSCDMPENSLTPDQLCSLNVRPIQADEMNYGQLETIYPEDPVQPQLQSEFLNRPKQNDLAPASQAALAQNTVLSSSEVTERTGEDEKPFHGQNVFFQMQSGLHKKKPTSVEIPPVPSISIPSSALGGSQRAFIEEEELASFSGFPQHQPQASCSTHNPHLQPFHLDSLLGYRSQIYLPSFNYLSTGPHLYASQTSNMPYPNCIPLHLPPKPTVHANVKQTGRDLIHVCQPQCLHCRLIFQNPFTPDMRFNCPPLSGRKLKPNIQWIPQNHYESFRLWQEYCIVAKQVYDSSPELEALACYFVHVLHSVHVHRPALPIPELLRKAILQWKKLSAFDRMRYYNMAQTFVEFEKKELEGIRAGPRQRMELSVQTSKQLGNVAVEVKNSNVQDLAEKALWEYSEVMKDLEANIKEGSAIAKETEEVDDMDEEQLTEYLNQLCSQKSVTEVEAEIDMAFISSLLSSDSNTTDMLMELGVVDNAQDAPTAITVEPVPFYSSNETTAECFSASAPKLHPPPETCDTQSFPPLQPGLYMTDGTNLPPYHSHFLQRDSKGQNLLDVQNTAPLVPSYTQETPKEESSSKKVMTEVRPANRDKNDTFFAPSCSSARPSVTDPLTVFQNVSQPTLDCSDFNIQQKESQKTYKKNNNLIVVPTTDYSVEEMVAPTTDYSVGETFAPTTEYSVGEIVMPSTETVNPTTEGSVGKMVPPSTDYSVGETVDPTSDFSVGEMVNLTTDWVVRQLVADCDVWDSFFSESISGECKFKDVKKKKQRVIGLQKMKEHKSEEQETCCHADAVEQTSSTEKSNRDKMKLLMDISKPVEVIVQTARNELNDLLQETEETVPSTVGRDSNKMVTPHCGVKELVPPTTDYEETGELFNMPGPKGEDAGSSMHGDNPQYFHVPRSKSYTDMTLLVPQDDAAIVTQRVHDPVINDQINESSTPKIKAYKMQEEPITQQLCVNRHNVVTDSTEAPLDLLGLQSFMAELVDWAIPSEDLTLGPDSSDELYQMLLHSLGEAEVELPQQDIDKGNATNNPPENTLASSIEKGINKEVRRTDAGAIKETDEHENMVNDHDYDKSKESETERVQSKMIQQTHAGSPVANEKVAVEMGQNATERSQDHCSLCTSEGDLGQDPNIEADQHNQLQTDGKKVITVSESCTNPKILTGRRNLGTPLDQEKANVLVGKKEKDHRHECKQELKKVGSEVAQQIKDQRNETRTSRSSKVVKVRDAFDENKKTRINKEKRQAQRKSERVSEQVPKTDSKTNAFVMNTRMTKREFISLISEDIAGTQNVKMTENSNSEMDGDTEQSPAEGRQNNASEIRSRSKSDVMTGRRKKIGTAYEKEKVLVSSKAGGESVHISTRSCNGTPGTSVAVPEKQMGDRRKEAGSIKHSKTTKTRNLRLKEGVISSSVAAHLSNEKRTRECGPVAEEAAENCAKTKEVELKSNTPKSYASSKSNGSGQVSALTTDKLKERTEKVRQSKKASKDEHCVGDKRPTRSYTASLQLQVENEENKTRKSDRRNGNRNQKEERRMGGVKKSARERQQKEIDAKEKVAKEERNDAKRITGCTVAQ